MRNILVILAIGTICFGQGALAQTVESKDQNYWYVLYEEVTANILTIHSIHCTRAEANAAVEIARDTVFNGRAVHAIPEQAFQKQKAVGLIRDNVIIGKPLCP